MQPFSFSSDIRRSEYWSNIPCIRGGDISFTRSRAGRDFEGNLKGGTYRIWFHCTAISMTMSMTAISASETVMTRVCTYKTMSSAKHAPVHICTRAGKHYFEREGTKLYIRVVRISVSDTLSSADTFALLGRANIALD